MVNLPAKALIIALAIFGPDCPEEGDKSDRLYHTIEHLGYGSDEFKAELYAHLEEKLVEGMGIVKAEAVILTALEKLHG